MYDLAAQLLFLALCLGAVVAAAFFPFKERWAAFCASLTLLGNWAFCQWVWTDVGPQMMLSHIGLHFKGVEMWALGDCVAGFLYLWYGLPNRWAWMLWGVAVFQEVAHYVQNDWYLMTLDALLVIQLSVFYVRGGPDAYDWLHDRLARVGSNRSFAALGHARTR